MLTVVLACDASGNSSTRRPLLRSYSVMPSTEGPWLMPGGSAACALKHRAAMKAAAHTRRIDTERAIMEVACERGADRRSARGKGGDSQWTLAGRESSSRADGFPCGCRDQRERRLNMPIRNIY